MLKLSVGLCFVALLAEGAGYAAAPHPRLWITPDDLPRLRAMPTDTQRNALGFVPAEAWQAIKERADGFAAASPYHYAVDMPGVEGGPSKRWEYTFSAQAPPRHDDYPHYPPWTAMFQERTDSITTRLQFLALAYVVSQDPVYLAKAKELALGMCAWSGIWTDPSYDNGQACLDTGHAAIWVGIFYDWCYDALSEAERQTIRAALAEKALEPIHKVVDGWGAYHNGTAVAANGMLIGGLALLGDDPRAQTWVDHGSERLLAYMDCQGKDGGPMEGPMYGTYAADQIADSLWALTTSGVPHTLGNHNYLKTLPRYCISLSNPNNLEMPCFGDGDPGRGPLGLLMLSIALTGNREAAWYCQQVGMFNPGAVRTFIILDPAKLKPEAPVGNPSACFVDVGYGILRDGYRRGTAYMAFKAGPPASVVGHNHYDHNSFVINYNGAWVASDPGYRSYFNPPDRRYTTSTLGHSSVVVDMDEAYLTAAGHPDILAGHDQVRLDGGRISEFRAGGAFDYLLGEAAAAYNSEAQRVLDRFDRQVVFAKPNVFFIRDALAAPEEHTFSSLLHIPAGEFDIRGSQAEGASGQGILQAACYSPQGMTLSEAAYPGAEHRGPYLAATTGRARAATITTVLVPRSDARLVANGGFEKGLLGWWPRNTPENVANHVVDKQEKHGGEASGRIDNEGYYYSHRFQVPVGTKITVRWWSKCSAATGATSVLYYWRQGTAFADTHGPVAEVNEWRPYEFTGVVPEGTEEVCLALNFFGQGQCWVDDVELTSDQVVPLSAPATIRPLRDGAAGAVCVVDGVTHIFLCGQAGERRTVRTAGHAIRTDAELAVVSLTAGGPKTFILRGTELLLDGKPVQPEAGTWLAKR